MKVILEIPDEEVEIIKRNGFNKDGTFSFKLNEVLKQAIRNGVILPDNATNGNMIMTMFPSWEIDMSDAEDEEYPVVTCWIDRANNIWTSFDLDWWNSPFKGEQEYDKA